MSKSNKQQNGNAVAQVSRQNNRPSLRFDARSFRCVARLGVLIYLMVSIARPGTATESSLAVINGGVSSAEDAPFVAPDYEFLPGDYLYVTFEIAGFAIHVEQRGEVKQISLAYEVAIEDKRGHPLAPPVSSTIDTSLSAEDKNWVPKRRTSFLLPSFLAAGPFQLRVTAKDHFAKTDATRTYSFLIGGTHIAASPSISVQDFRFLRSENATESLTVPAYSPGDTVFAKFELAGFQNSSGNEHHVAYGVSVLGPDGKAFINDPQAADLQAGGFYPAQFVPGDLALKMGKNNARGQYLILLTARDLVANQQVEVKQVFSLE